MKYILIFLVAFFIGKAVGYRHAHIVIGLECERLGGFFINNKVYECKLVREVEDQRPRHGAFWGLELQKLSEDRE